MKTCFKCHSEKPLFDFYAHKDMKDGHLNKCKECTKKDASAHRSANLDMCRRYDVARAALPHRVALRARVVKDWQEKTPDRRKANNTLNNAVRDGKVTPWPVCAEPECCSTRPVAHHPDYSRPLDVVWLCQAHHKQAHAISKT